MDSTFASSSSSLFHSHTSSSSPPLSPHPQSKPKPKSPSLLHFAPHKPSYYSSPTPRFIRVFNSTTSTHNINNPVILTIHSTAKTLIFATTATLFVGKLTNVPPAYAYPPPLTISDQTLIPDETETAPRNEEEQGSLIVSSSLESNTAEAIHALRDLFQEMIEVGDDDEALKVLRELVSAQPTVMEWKLIMARLLNHMDRIEESRKAFKEVLESNLSLLCSFEAMFENDLLMDRCGEGEAVIKRLEEALNVAAASESENQELKEGRDVRLVMAQIELMYKNVEEALKMYEELVNEDPNDYRPYFCKGIIYSFTDRNAEAEMEFVKYWELSPKNLEVEGFLRMSHSRMKLFGTKFRRIECS